jgi:5-methylcytosine-specific restriction endonuclease McrA
MTQNCKLPGCENKVQNWRKEFCCKSHAAKAGALSKGLKLRTKEDTIVYHRIKATERQQRIKRATPPWANLTAIREFYKEARKLELETGIVHEVDHVIPLKGRLVSGLHVETNLQILTKDDNRSKANHYELA